MQKQSGTNVVGVVRASRSSSTEAMIVAVSMTKTDLEALAVVLALATYCRGVFFSAYEFFRLVLDSLNGISLD